MGFATRISVGGMVLIAVMMATHANLAMAARWSTFTIPGCTTNDCTFEYYHSNGQTRKKNWKDAKSICQKKHRAELVSIASAEEQAFVATLGSGTTWLGLKRYAALCVTLWKHPLLPPTHFYFLLLFRSYSFC